MIKKVNRIIRLIVNHAILSLIFQKEKPEGKDSWAGSVLGNVVPGSRSSWQEPKQGRKEWLLRGVAHLAAVMGYKAVSSPEP